MKENVKEEEGEARIGGKRGRRNLAINL